MHSAFTIIFALLSALEIQASMRLGKAREKEGNENEKGTKGDIVDYGTTKGKATKGDIVD
jgi:hypothetical protein